jgi:hypothetical protein
LESIASRVAIVSLNSKLRFNLISDVKHEEFERDRRMKTRLGTNNNHNNMGFKKDYKQQSPIT